MIVFTAFEDAKVPNRPREDHGRLALLSPPPGQVFGPVPEKPVGAQLQYAGKDAGER